MSTKTSSLLIPAIVLLSLSCAISPAAALKNLSRHPYAGAIVVDAATGKVLFEDHADAKGYPASVTKLMLLLIILEAADSHRLHLDELVEVTADASKVGGSEVYLRKDEVFPLEELLYALMIQSANDAATALAIHYAGSEAAFVKLMNRRAKEIGMRNTQFHTVNGLPPGRGRQPDVSTPRDFAGLCRELLKHPKALKYTSAKARPFREDTGHPLIMINHNQLLADMDRCDGLKTGYFRAAGFSIAATATSKNRRAIAVVFGSKDRQVRDARTKELLARGLNELVKNPPPPVPAPAPPSPSSRSTQRKPPAPEWMAE
jgi:D-alanyl-D-alanine carboxypeptidase (penicillin-binding protein 5/6)